MITQKVLDDMQRKIKATEDYEKTYHQMKFKNDKKLHKHLDLLLSNKPYAVLNRKQNRVHKPNHEVYAKLKQYQLFVANLYKDVGMTKHSDRLADCGSFLKFITDDSGKHPLCVKRFACHDRFCSICQHVLSRQYTFMLIAMLNALNSKKTRAGYQLYAYTFITPTIQDITPIYDCKGNIDSDKTGKYIKATFRLNNLITRNFLKTPQLDGVKGKGRILGSIIKHELTVSHKLLFNIHNHLINIHHKSYYHSKYYMTQAQYRQLWNETLKSTCSKVVKSKSKRFDFWFKRSAKFQLKYQAKQPHGFVLNVEKPYYKKLVTYNNGTKHYVKRYYDNADTKAKDKATKHAASEMSKYTMKSQDLQSMLKHGVTKGKVLDVFNALRLGLKSTSHISFTGLFNYYHKLFNQSKLDKYTYQAKNGIVYSLLDIAKYDFKKCVYNDRFYPLSDSQKLYIRHTFHVPTHYTKQERHMNFDTLHDKKLLKRITNKENKANKLFYLNRDDVSLHKCKSIKGFYRKLKSFQQYKDDAIQDYYAHRTGGSIGY